MNELLRHRLSHLAFTFDQFETPIKSEEENDNLEEYCYTSDLNVEGNFFGHGEVEAGDIRINVYWTDRRFIFQPWLCTVYEDGFDYFDLQPVELPVEGATLDKFMAKVNECAETAEKVRESRFRKFFLSAGTSEKNKYRTEFYVLNTGYGRMFNSHQELEAAISKLDPDELINASDGFYEKEDEKAVLIQAVIDLIKSAEIRIGYDNYDFYHGRREYRSPIYGFVSGYKIDIDKVVDRLLIKQRKQIPQH